MNSTLPESTESFTAIKVSGRLEAKDLEEIRPEFERKMRQYGPISAYIELLNIEDCIPKAYWDQTETTPRQNKNSERVAIVCEPRWRKVAAKVASPLEPADVRYFSIAEKRIARDWAKFGA